MRPQGKASRYVNRMATSERTKDRVPLAPLGRCKVCGQGYSEERSCEHVFSDPENAVPRESE